MEIVKIFWLAGCNSDMNWIRAEKVEVEPMLIETFGVIIQETEDFIAIAQNYCNDPVQYSNITTIPKGCIKEILQLTKKMNNYE